MIAKPIGTFSADVKLNLYVDGEVVAIGQLGPDFGIFRDPRTFAASEGELETVIDGNSSRWKIRFTSPITSESKRFTFEAV